MTSEYTNVPFKEAISFFKDKVRLPSKTWRDIEKGMHSRAFVVAGAMKDELLADMQKALTKALEQGTTLAEFRKDFDGIVQKRGWTYKGKRGWRTGVIYRTNLSTAYQAGRYKQMLDPDVVKARPYLQYIHGDSSDPRPQHLAWDGLVLRHDDPFWNTHRPKNGWGCSCSVRSLSAGDLKRMGKSEPDAAPPIEIDPTTNRPKGIDEGWDYDPAFTAWGKPLADKAMSTWRAEGAHAWALLTTGTWRNFNRPARISVDKAKAKLAKPVQTKEQARTLLQKTLKADEKVFTLPDGSKILVNADSLLDHIDLNRAHFLPLLPELLEQPFEVWLTFQQHKGTGQIQLRKRLIKAIKLDKERFLILSAQARNGIFEAWTIIPTRDLRYGQHLRVGTLL